MGATKTRENGSIGTSNSNNRQELIYRIIKQSGPLSIKDIAQNVPGVSSKTVQRELVSLVQSGRLKREGDRRWSRYSAV
jgi:DeoR/GlpR family transcriptional regulator of sugar metabolism